MLPLTSLVKAMRLKYSPFLIKYHSLHPINCKIASNPFVFSSDCQPRHQSVAKLFYEANSFKIEGSDLDFLLNTDF